MAHRSAAALLASAWHRDQRRWWRASAATLALVLVALLVVSGLFSGVQSATERRVADFYTGELRVTQRTGTVTPDDAWTGAQVQQVRAILGAGAHPRLETELILSRRSLVESLLEQEQWELNTGSADQEEAEHYGVGILLGVEESDPLRARIRQHLVVGTMPVNTSGPLQLAMGLRTFESFLSQSERENLSAWPPQATELEPFRFEATAGYVDRTTRFKLPVARPAVVVGLFKTDLDALDTLTTVADWQAAISLTGMAGDRANVFTVAGDPGPARQAAARERLHAEASAAFAGRYLGQLLGTVQALSVFSVGLFLAVPAFLLWHGIQQLLDRQRREVAVCRAIGVPRRELDAALRRLTWRVVGGGVLAAAIGLGLLWLAIPAILESWRPVPLPMEFRLDFTMALVAVALVLVSTGAALLLAARRGHHENIPAALRSA